MIPKAHTSLWRGSRALALDAGSCLNEPDPGLLTLCCVGPQLGAKPSTASFVKGGNGGPRGQGLCIPHLLLGRGQRGFPQVSVSSPVLCCEGSQAPRIQGLRSFFPGCGDGAALDEMRRYHPWVLGLPFQCPVGLSQI